MKRKNWLILYILIFLFLVCLGFNTYFSIPYYKMNSVKFQNLDNIHLSAKYSPSTNGKGVMIVTDLSHDKSELTSMVYELSSLGYGIYIFDFPSQGGSEGTIPFHSNENTYLAEQFYDAMVSYSQLENMNVSHIHVIAYGSGARAVLQTVSMGFIKPASITLIGTDINLTNRLQYNVLNFTIDSEIDWVKNLTGFSSSFPIHLIASKLDNISTIEDNELLLAMLSSNPNYNPANALSSNVSIKLSTVSDTVHYMLMHNYTIQKMVLLTVAEQDNISYTSNTLLNLRNISVMLMFMLLIPIFYVSGQLISLQTTLNSKNKLKVPHHFIREKLIFWLPSLIIIGLIPIAFYLLPINYPYNDIFKLSLFISYGITMMLLYKFSNFADGLGGVFFTANIKINNKAAIGVGVLTLALISMISFSGMIFLFSWRSKLIWLFLFTILCAIIFYIDEKERDFFADSVKKNLQFITMNYLGSIIAPIILIAIGMYNTAFVLLGMLFILIVTLSMEFVLKKLNSSVLINSIIKAFIFQLLVFAQSTMFLK